MAARQLRISKSTGKRPRLRANPGRRPIFGRPGRPVGCLPFVK